MIKATVTVRLKKGVEDPEGLAVSKTLNVLNYKNVKDVRVFKLYEIKMDGEELDQVKRELIEMCERLLVNPVIHDYDISLERVE